MSGWRQKGGGDTWRAWWKQFDGNMTQLGQQVRGEFTPLSSYKCEAVMSTHTHTCRIEPEASSQQSALCPLWGDIRGLGREGVPVV